MRVPSSEPMTRNVDAATVAGFGQEWSTFDQRAVAASDLDEVFRQYFAVFPWHALPRDAEGFDMGCGSGRWAARVAPRVGRLHCVDASPAALEVARRALAAHRNCELHEASVEDVALAPGSMDFGYALGVLHHVPDPQRALQSCAALLKPGAPFLLYLYYALDNRPGWYRAIWRASDFVRRFVSHRSHRVKLAVSSVTAVLIYLPLARGARLARRLGLPHRNLPLAFYADRSLYTMRTDAYDRLGTRLERRFTRAEVEAMARAAGLEDIRFSDAPPYWCAVGFRA